MAAKKKSAKKSAKRSRPARAIIMTSELTPGPGEKLNSHTFSAADELADDTGDELAEMVPGAGAVPNLEDVIGGAVGAGMTDSGAGTALDELAERIKAEEAARIAPASQPAAQAVYSAPVQGEPAKRGRGRPRKDATAAPAGPVVIVATDGTTTPGKMTKDELAARVAELESRNARLAAQADTHNVGRLADSLRFLAVGIFAPLAMWRGDHWELSEEEATQLAEPTAHALAPYSAEIEEKLPWAAPCLALVTVLGRRLLTDYQIQKRAEEIAAARVPATSVGVGG